MRFIFHAGMGKTGSSSIQAALAQSGPELEAQGMHYLGMWMPGSGPGFEGHLGFQKFLELDPAQAREAAERLVAHATHLAGTRGIRTFIHSNEANRSVPFFRAMAAQAQVQVLVYVRPPAQWLPSAHVQWGIVHKTNHGPVSPFGVSGRRLMVLYQHVQTLHEGLGDLLSVQPYPEQGDIVEDFSRVIGVELKGVGARIQPRPSIAETILRGTFNSGSFELQPPESFNAATGMTLKPSALPTATAKHRYHFDPGEIPEIVAENRPLFEWFETEFGISMTDVRDVEAPAPSFEALADGLLGYLVDLACAQAHQIVDLKKRLKAVEKTLSRT